jgi:hypothetical protein
VRIGQLTNFNSQQETDVTIQQITNQLQSFNAPGDSFARGNRVTANEIANASLARAHYYRANQAAIGEVLNAAGDNTLAAGLKRDVIMQELVRAFALRVLNLNAFSTVFSNVPLEGANKVQVPYCGLDENESQVFSAATGYALAGETTTGVREITVGMGATDGGRWFQDLAFTSEEIARQPFLKTVELARLKAEKLASDIVANVLSVVTAANYGAAVISELPDGFDSDDIANLVTACKHLPQQGRSLFLDTSYHVALLKDESFKAAMNAASDSAIKEGRLFPRVMGFDYVENPNIPGNSENSVGFAAHKSAILVAFAPVPPIAEVRASGTSYRVYTDAASGVALEYRTFGDNVLDRATHIVEASFGWAPGNAAALKRITSA